MDWKKIKVKELAGLICKNLKEDGIQIILVGGSCVTIYSNNRYLSHDLDYVGYEDFWSLDQAIEVCLENRVNIRNIHQWSKKQGFEQKFLMFKKELHKRNRPSPV
jgi:hypothetical protein